jgi:hypothetical protein
MRLATRLLALSVPVLLAACDLGGPPDRHERLTLDADGVRVLRISNGSGDIAIEGDPLIHEVSIVAAIYGDDTEVTHASDGDTLVLAHDCPVWTDRCAIDWTLRVPADLAADLETGAGDIVVRGLTGEVRVETGSGDIGLADLDAPRLTVETGSGDVTGHDLRCLEFRGEAGSGDLALELDLRPRSVSWSSGSGCVALAVPTGRYDLDVEAGSGDVVLEGVRRDAAADASLRLHTGSGDICVTN